MARRKKIELTPPNTYGVNLDCIDNDHVIASYRYEADHGAFRSADARFTDKQFFAEGRNRSCDSVKVRVNLGQGETRGPGNATTNVLLRH